MVVKPFPTHDDQERAVPISSVRVSSAETSASTVSSAVIVGQTFTSTVSSQAWNLYNSDRERSRSVVPIREVSAARVTSSYVTPAEIRPEGLTPSPSRSRSQGPRRSASIMPPCRHVQAHMAVPNADTAPSNRAAAAAGSLLTVSGEKYRLEKKLGQGMYGTVWSGNKCKGEDRGELREVAIKMMEPSDATNMNLAKFELFVLQELSKKIPESSEAASHVPRYIGHNIAFSTKIGSQEMQASVNVVMSKVNGSPVDEWLYGLDVEDQKHTPASLLLDGPLPGSRLGRFDFSEACAVTTCIIKQLATVLDPLSEFAFHRDISAHNVMVSGTGPLDLQCVLIDFGLCVKKQDWCHTWRTALVCGDARYWMPAAWLITAHGVQALDRQPCTLKQYTEKIDHYATGILALEVFFSLWQQPAGSCSQKDQAAHQAFKPARNAWRKYWEQAVQLWQDAQECSSFAQLQKAMIREQSVHHLNMSLRELKIALRQLASKAIGGSQGLLKIIVDLIDDTSTTSWKVASKLTFAETPNVTSKTSTRASSKETETRRVIAPALDSTRPSMKGQESTKGISIHVETVKSASSNVSAPVGTEECKKSGGTEEWYKVHKLTTTGGTEECTILANESISYSPAKPVKSFCPAVSGFPQVVKHTSVARPAQSPSSNSKDEVHHEDPHEQVAYLRAQLDTLQKTKDTLQKTKDAEIALLKTEIDQLRQALTEQRSGANRALEAFQALGHRNTNEVRKTEKTEKSNAKTYIRAPEKENQEDYCDVDTRYSLKFQRDWANLTNGPVPLQVQRRDVIRD